MNKIYFKDDFLEIEQVEHQVQSDGFISPVLNMNWDRDKENKETKDAVNKLADALYDYMNVRKKFDE